jgi:AbiV family abortive infection protein
MNSDPVSYPNPYLGSLSPRSAEEGIGALQANASRLARDAKLMLHARRNSTAALLGAMAITELSRIPRILDLATKDEGAALELAWRRVRAKSHPFPWMIFQSSLLNIREDYLNTVIGLMKQVGSQVECVDPGAWVAPDDLISRPLAEALVNTAELLCSQKIDLQAAGLWIHVVRSLPKTASDRRVLGAYRSALAAAGLKAEAAKLGELLISIDVTADG